jgi:hypothetical protein
MAAGSGLANLLRRHLRLASQRRPPDTLRSTANAPSYLFQLICSVAALVLLFASGNIAQRTRARWWCSHLGPETGTPRWLRISSSGSGTTEAVYGRLLICVIGATLPLNWSGPDGAPNNRRDRAFEPVTD